MSGIKLIVECDVFSKDSIIAAIAEAIEEAAHKLSENKEVDKTETCMNCDWENDDGGYCTCFFTDNSTSGGDKRACKLFLDKWEIERNEN